MAKNKDGLEGGQLVSAKDFAAVQLRKRQAATKKLEEDRAKEVTAKK